MALLFQLVILLSSPEVFAQAAGEAPPAVGNAEAVEGLAAGHRERMRMYWDWHIVRFCKEQEDAELAAGQAKGVRPDLDRARRICERCRATRCPEYESWVVDEARERARDDLAVLQRCLDRTLSSDQVRKCRSDLRNPDRLDNTLRALEAPRHDRR